MSKQEGTSNLNQKQKYCKICGAEIDTSKKKYCGAKCGIAASEIQRQEKMRLKDIRRNVEVWTLDMKTWIWTSNQGRIDLPDYLLGKENLPKVKEYMESLKNKH